MAGASAQGGAGASPAPLKGPALALVAFALALGTFMQVLDSTIANVSLPTIAGNLGVSSDNSTWVVTAFAVANGVAVPLTGWLMGKCGVVRTFCVSVFLFTIASFLCGIAWNLSSLIGFRILQGAVSGPMIPGSQALLISIFPPQKRSTALGIWSMTTLVAPIMGPILGGYISDNYHWSWIFLINVPIGLVAFVGGLTVLGDSRAPRAQRLDLGGVVLLSLTLALLVYPLIEGRESGWPVWIVAMLIACPAMLAVFIAFERRLAARGGAPLVELSLFANGSFVLGVLMALALYLLASFYLTFAVYLQSGRQLTPLAAGVAMLPYAGGYFAASLASAVVMQRLRARTLTLGFALQVLGFGSVALTVAGIVAVPLSAGLACAGIGFGLVMPSVIKVVIGGVDPRHAGLASGIAISTFQIASALGVAVIGGVFYTVLGDGRDLAAYAHAFAVALGCNVVLLALGALLSLGLWDEA